MASGSSALGTIFEQTIREVGVRRAASRLDAHAHVGAEGLAGTLRERVADEARKLRSEAAVLRRAARHGVDLAVHVLVDVDAVLIRKDPPFDQAYLYATLLLEQARGKTLIVNDPRGLRDANEKLYAMNFPEWTPRTIVTADRDMIHDFVEHVGGVAVIKPLDAAGGSGVIQLRKDDKNVRAIVDLLTNEGERLAMVQAFLPAVTVGDKRVLLIDGEPLGAILRVPRADDIRSNIHAGGSVVPTELTRARRSWSARSPRACARTAFISWAST
jgi:glutathione synthase